MPVRPAYVIGELILNGSPLLNDGSLSCQRTRTPVTSALPSRTGRTTISNDDCAACGDACEAAARTQASIIPIKAL
jgi:hypothetical protein